MKSVSLNPRHFCHFSPRTEQRSTFSVDFIPSLATDHWSWWISDLNYKKIQKGLQSLQSALHQSYAQQLYSLRGNANLKSFPRKFPASTSEKVYEKFLLDQWGVTTGDSTAWLSLSLAHGQNSFLSLLTSDSILSNVVMSCDVCHFEKWTILGTSKGIDKRSISHYTRLQMDIETKLETFHGFVRIAAFGASI